MKNILLSLMLFAASLSGLQAQTGNYPTEEIITSVLQKYTEQEELAGIVTVVATKDNIISINCTGYSNIVTKDGMSPNTMFWIASQTKPVTATAIMMLVDEGLVDLDVPITTYLPELKNLYILTDNSETQKVEKLLSKPITLRHLLSHTSGMKWAAGIQERMGHIDVLPLDISVYASAMTPLQSEPGERYLYSNQGINVAAAVLERVTGKKIEEFLKERLFNPLGMDNTTFWPTDKQLEDYAPPHTMDKEGKLEPSLVGQLQYPLQDRSKRYAEAAGGLFSTTVDMVKFYQMILNKGIYKGKRIVSEKSIAEMGKRQTSESMNDSYGLGWSVAPGYMGHGGACGTEAKVYTNNGFVVIYIAQENGLPQNKEAQKDFFDTVYQMYNIK